IYAIAGFSGAGDQTIVEAYSPAANSWSTVASLNTPRFDLAGAAGADGRIYAIGGVDSNGTVFNTVEALSFTTAPAWSTVAAMPTKRYTLAAAAGADGRLYAIGGFNVNGILNTVEAYNPFTNSWATVASLPTAR